MSLTANELAKAIRTTFETREASWDDANAKYRLTYEQAAQKARVDPAIRKPVIAMLASGYSDFPDWAEATLQRNRSRTR